MLTLVSDLLLGGLLGAFFFGGLWWTVQRLEQFRYPVAVTLGSFIVRSAVVVGGFYLMLAHGWQGVGIGLLGFLVVRMVLVRIWGPVTTPATAVESTG
jgi:F1F0 ATPase subunit 2